MRLLPCGPAALLVELPDAATRARWDAPLRRVPGVAEVVPGAVTLLARLEPGADPDEVGERVRALVPDDDDRETDDRPPLELVVAYDGEDLAEVASLFGGTPTDVVAWHTGQTWRCEFTGFMPGFGYLAPTGDARQVRRRSSPRPRVPAGAVGLAGEWSGVYPRVSPGGWQVIGRTSARLWDGGADPPALLTPGRLVRFVPGEVDEVSAGPALEAVAGPEVLVVERAGPLTLVEDGGRPGRSRWGVPVGGAADAASWRMANRLAGAPETAAALEVLLGGLVLRGLDDVVVAVAGAPAPLLVDDRPVAQYQPLLLRAGQRLSIGTATQGVRLYVAVGGGLAAPTEAGSSGSSPSSGLGPPPLRPGDVLRGAGLPRLAVATTDLTAAAVVGGRVTLRMWPGPRTDWFTADAQRACVTTAWRVGPQSDRVGVRLVGPALARECGGELASEPLVPGAVQVPPSGQPIVFGVDHPTTGGYPVIGVVDERDLGLVGQVRPGDEVRFHPQGW